MARHKDLAPGTYGDELLDAAAAHEEAVRRYAGDGDAPVVDRIKAILAVAHTPDRVSTDVLQRLNDVQMGKITMVHTLGGLVLGVPHARKALSIVELPKPRHLAEAQMGLRVNMRYGRILRSERMISGVGYGGGGTDYVPRADVDDLNEDSRYVDLGTTPIGPANFAQRLLRVPEVVVSGWDEIAEAIGDVPDRTDKQRQTLYAAMGVAALNIGRDIPGTS